MKYSFLSFSTPQLSLAEMLALADKTGYAGIELRLASQHRHGVEIDTSSEERGKLLERTRSYKAKICCLSSSLQFADPAKTEATKSDAHKIITLASVMEVPAIRVFGGIIPEGTSREDAMACAADALREIAGFARANDVSICVETHDDWCDPGDIRNLMQKVNHPAVKVNWDFFHNVIRAGKTVEESFDLLREWIGHVHIHDGQLINGKIEWQLIGSGKVDHAAAIRCLMQINYDGYLSGEWIGRDDEPDHLAKEIVLLKKIERSMGV